MPIPDTMPTGLSESFGSEPEVDEKTLEPEKRAINSVQQAYSVAETMIYDARKKILQAAKITAKINGAPPKNPRTQANQGKDWQSNVSTGALATTCAKIPPRLWMPIKTARYLISSALPPETPQGTHKSESYRRIITTAIRSWKKWPFFVQGLARETSYYGYAFGVFFDEYEWRPTMLRMDRGFVPVGTEIMDENMPFFLVKYDYKPGDMLKLAKDSLDVGSDSWQKDNVVKAVNAAAPPLRSAIPENVRGFEDLIRQGTQWLSFTKGAKLIQTLHLFAREMDGRVSHYILLADENGNAYGNLQGSADTEGLLYQKLDSFESMADCVDAFVFEFGNGTIHGALGAGQILYDMAVQVELTRNDSFDSLKMAGRIKIETADAKDINQVKMQVQDDKVIVAGGKYNGLAAGLTSNTEAFIALDQKVTGLMDEKVGAFLPPAPIPGTSPTATQVNIQAQREDEVRNAILENWLTQFAQLTHSMERRLTNPDSPDPVAKDVLKKLLAIMSQEEIDELRDQVPTETILSFTDIIQKQKAAFAASKTQGPNAALYDQFQLEQLQAEAMVGQDTASVILPPGEDKNKTAEAARQQMIEANSLLTGTPIPVVPGDNHFVHMQTLKPVIDSFLQQASQYPNKIQGVEAMLQHYDEHYQAGVATKTLPKDDINAEKKLIRSWEVALDSVKQKAAAQAKIDEVKQAQLQLLQQRAAGQVPGTPPPQAMPPDQGTPAAPTQPGNAPSAAGKQPSVINLNVNIDNKDPQTSKSITITRDPVTGQTIATAQPVPPSTQQLPLPGT
jgi:hypothetical protein